MRYGTIALMVALAVGIPTAADAKRSKGNEIAKLRAQIVELRREIRALQVRGAPAPAIVASLTQFPVEGLDRVLWPPVAPIPAPEVEKPNLLQAYRASLPGVSMDKAPAQLQDWMRKVANACHGFKATSVCRPGARVRGSGRVSLHASCRAVDFQVTQPACARAVLAKFPGGLSTDYAAVRHFHASWAPNGREWAARFVHGGRSYAAKRWKARYAKRGHRA